MGLIFFIAVLFGLALCVVFPGLLPFVILGIALGALPSLLDVLRARRGKRVPLRQRRRSLQGALREARRAPLKSLGSLLGLLLAVLLLLVVLSPFLMFSGPVPLEHPDQEFGEIEPPLTLVMPATYHGRGIYLDDPERLELVDRLEMPRNGHEVELVALLGKRGWSFAKRSTLGNTFELHRRIRLEAADFLPAETGNSIALPGMPKEIPARDRLLEIDLDSESSLALVAPPRTFGSSYPEGIRVEHPVSGEEELVIPVSSSDPVEVDVRSPWSRMWLAAQAVDWVRADAVKTIFGLMLTGILIGASKRGRRFLKRVLGMDQFSPAPANG